MLDDCSSSRYIFSISTGPSRRSRFFLLFFFEVENQISSSTEGISKVTNLRYRRPACDKSELLKSANSICIPLFAHFHGEAISLSSNPESDISQKSYI